MAGVIVGAVVGAVAGILFAPASGKETRTKIAEKGVEVKEMAMDTAKEKKESVVGSSKELIAKLREKLPKTKDIQDALDDAEKDVTG